MSDDLRAIFRAVGLDAEGKPKRVTFQCQRQGATAGETCSVTVNGHANSSGASWKCPMADSEKPMMTPTIKPSIRCGASCHFWITDGVFTYEPDHKGQRHG